MIWAYLGPDRCVPEHIRKYTIMPIPIGEICDAGNEQARRLANMTDIQPMRLDDGTKPSQQVCQTDEKYHKLGARYRDTAWVIEIRHENAEGRMESRG
jgi:hypothetical protein